MAKHYYIVLSDSDASALKVKRKDTITWINSTDSMINIDLPYCVNPPDNATIQPGENSDRYTVNSHRFGDYEYSFETDGREAPRNGKIEI